MSVPPNTTWAESTFSKVKRLREQVSRTPKQLWSKKWEAQCKQWKKWTNPKNGQHLEDRKWSCEEWRDAITDGEQEVRDEEGDQKEEIPGNRGRKSD